MIMGMKLLIDTYVILDALMARERGAAGLPAPG
jgi:hypothetical protein